MDNDALLDLLLEAIALKQLPRSGWVRAGVPRPESVASHSWGVSFLIVTLLPEELDLQRALAYGCLHDVPEIRVGDITPHDGVTPEDKRHRETEAMHALCAPLPARVQKLWDAYEAQADPEARFVKELDRLDMALQAVVYHQQYGLDLQEFLESAQAKISSPSLKRLMEGLRQRHKP